MELKKTALHDVHVQLGAKMVPFAGYAMPLRYTSELEEHRRVRERVGLFDVSHMGEFLVQGPEAADLIQSVTSNDVRKLYDGKAQYSALINELGGIVDDLLVYRLRRDEYMLVVNASNIQKDWEWLQRHNRFEARLQDISDGISLFAVQGPYATQAIQRLTMTPLDSMANYTFVVTEFADAPNIIVSATGYTGAGGYEIYVPNQYAQQVWEQILDSGRYFGMRPIGLGARDTLRLEMGYCLYGNDLSDDCSPLEAGLGWITSLDKDFVGAEQLRARKQEGLTRKLIGFLMLEKSVPRAGYDICDEAGEVIGKVTSGTQSPSLNVGIGMGYVHQAHAKPGQEVQIKIGDKFKRARIQKFPLYQPAPRVQATF